MGQAFTLKKANHKKHYDSGMYDQAVKQVEEQKKQEADEKLAKEKKENEFKKIKEENKRLEKEREEDNIKQLKFKNQTLQAMERAEIAGLVCQLKLYRYTVKTYDEHVENVTNGLSHALKSLTENSQYDRAGQVISSLGNMVTSTCGVLGVVTGPLGVGVTVAPSVIGFLASLYFKTTSDALTEKVCNISHADEKHLADISTQENIILKLIINLWSERLKSDILHAIGSTQKLKYRLQTLLEHQNTDSKFKFVCQEIQRALTGVAGISNATKQLTTTTTIYAETDKTIQSVAIRTATDKTGKSVTEQTMQNMPYKETEIFRVKKTPEACPAQTAIFALGLVIDAKKVYDNTLDYKEPEIFKKINVNIDENKKTRNILGDLMSEIDHVITQLTDTNPGA
ncbi:uncharacterized protein LOC126814275 isoform X2 [Patella vulgata]|nr:uncharacterized protein LOC126814275 isoform X2 [Patella vulgata]